MQSETKKRKFKNLALAEEKNVLPGFDPATLYVDELRRAYGHVALFFRDPLDGAVVGVVWNPSVSEF